MPNGGSPGCAEWGKISLWGCARTWAHFAAPKDTIFTDSHPIKHPATLPTCFLSSSGQAAASVVKYHATIQNLISVARCAIDQSLFLLKDQTDRTRDARLTAIVSTRHPSAILFFMWRNFPRVSGKPVSYTHLRAHET